MSEAECVLDGRATSFALCAPTDAIDGDPGEALAVLSDLGVRHCELRAVDGVSVLDGGPEIRAELRRSLRSSGVQVAVLDSDIGLEEWSVDLGPRLERLELALEIATELDAAAVRVFPFLTVGKREEAADQVVADRLREMGRRAAASGVVLLVENLPGSLGESGVRLGELLQAVDSPSVGALFNPASFVALKQHPFLGAWLPGHLKNHVRCLRIRDSRFGDQRPVLPDQGNGDLRELVSALAARSYDGFYTLDFGLPATCAGFRAGMSAFQRILRELL